MLVASAEERIDWVTESTEIELVVDAGAEESSAEEEEVEVREVVEDSLG